MVKKIENSRLIYNRKEPIKVALKKTYILANMLEDTIDLSEKTKLNRAFLIEQYKAHHEVVSKYSTKKLNSLIEDKSRLKRFEKCKWTVESVDVKDLGHWPCLGGIDHFTTSGNVLSAKDKIIDLLTDGNKFEWPTKPSLPDQPLARFILEVRYADFIYKHYPIIVTAKGSNTRRVTADKVGREKFGLGYTITPYDIEDGNHRATSLTLFGLRRIRCFVGRGLVTD